MWTVRLVGLDLSMEQHLELLASAEGSLLAPAQVVPDPGECWGWAEDGTDRPAPLQYKHYHWGGGLAAQARVRVVRAPCAGAGGDRTTTLAVAKAATEDDDDKEFSEAEVKVVVAIVLPAPWDVRQRRWAVAADGALVAAFVGGDKLW